MLRSGEHMDAPDRNVGISTLLVALYSVNSFLFGILAAIDEAIDAEMREAVQWQRVHRRISSAAAAVANLPLASDGETQATSDDAPQKLNARSGNAPDRLSFRSLPDVACAIFSQVVPCVLAESPLLPTRSCQPPPDCIHCV